MYSSTHKRGCFCIGMNSFELFTRLLRIADVKERLFFYGGGRPQKGPFRQWNLHRFMKCLTAWKVAQMP